MGGSLVSSYGYDAERRLGSVARVAGPSDLVDVAYGWTARHEIATETDQLRRGSRSEFGYDGAGRLTLASFAVPTGKTPEDAAWAVSLSIDPVKNIQGRTDRWGGIYGREVPEITVGAGNRYTTYGGRSLSYDDDGALESDESRTLTWDWAGRLASSTQEGVTITYVYDALGRRVKRTEGGEPSTYSWYDGWQLIEETNLAGDVVFEVLNGRAVDEPLQYRWDGQWYRPLQDRMGSVTGVLSETDELLEAYEYDPYGRFRRHGQESVEQVRLESLTLVVRFTGEMGSAAAEAVTLTPRPPGEWTITEDGRELHFLPTDSETDADTDPDWPTSGSVAINVPATARSAFGVALASGWSGSLDMAHMEDQVVADNRPPSVEQVVQDADGAIRVLFSEPMQSDGLASSLILREHGSTDPVPATVVLEADRMSARIEADEPLTAGATYDLDLGEN